MRRPWWMSLFRSTVELLLGTLRCRYWNEAAVRELVTGRTPFVLVFWHGSMLFPWWYFRNGYASALVSRSKDGHILSELLGDWNYRVVRGSSSRGGKEAMSLMREAIDAGHCLLVTPDGPRGPRRELKIGALRVAQTKGVPLLYVLVEYGRRMRLSSWDAFEIPLPFARAEVYFSESMDIPQDAEGEAFEALRAGIEFRMRMTITDHFGAGTS